MNKTISMGVILVLGMAGQVGKADFVFGTPANLGPTINSSAMDFDSSISPDGLSLYFGSERPGGSGGKDLWVTTRATVTDPWGQPVNLGPTVNSSAWESCPSISADGLSMYFESNRSGGIGDQDIWVTSRPTPDGDWGPPVNLGPTVNSSVWDSCPNISADGLSLYFDSYRPGGSGSCDLWVTTRATVSDPWGQPVNLGPMVNSSAWEYQPGISTDGLILFFFSNQSGGSGDDDLWITKRASTSDPWTEAANLGPMVNSSARDICPYISADGSTLYFSSSRSGGVGNMDLWQLSISPVVDFNGDGIVDAADMCIMVDHWGENYSYCDIGPTPLGDGIIDAQDLVALSEYFFEDINDPTLISHWALDEAEGMFVFDSAGDNDGYAMGDPIWQPDGGLVDGALQLDGVDDYVITGAALNPADGPFSVLAWVKDGSSGQVVVSQQFAANWLMVDAQGNLMTELQGTGRSASPLQSKAIINDGHWHRIGFVWDGLNRILYVDGVAVTQDTQDSLGGSASGLYIGCGKGMEPGTYFSGLVDDIRIYNRAVSP